jgi:hypothetical protein
VKQWSQEEWAIVGEDSMALRSTSNAADGGCGERLKRENLVKISFLKWDA